MLVFGSPASCARWAFGIEAAPTRANKHIHRFNKNTLLKKHLHHKTSAKTTMTRNDRGLYFYFCS